MAAGPWHVLVEPATAADSAAQSSCLQHNAWCKLSIYDCAHRTLQGTYVKMCLFLALCFRNAGVFQSEFRVHIENV
jgi:hypothetical protein